MTIRTATEYRHAINGAPGRMTPAHIWPANDPKVSERARGRISSQTWVSGRRPCPSYGQRAYIQAEIRFDDNCKNGRESFAITATIANPGDIDRNWLAGGCCHDEIAAAFPELAHLIPWHLTSLDGPMHYAANAVYMAGDRDHHGKRAGEPWAWETAVRFGAVPIRHKVPKGLKLFLDSLADYDPAGREAALEVLAVAYVGESYSTTFSPYYQFAGQPPLKWHDCPFKSEDAALRFADAFLNHSPVFEQVPTLWSEGKARDLDAARRVAVWPEATDAELMQEPDALRAALEARLPALLERFRADIDGAGFAFSAAELTA